MEKEISKKEDVSNQNDSQSKIKTRSGSGYLRQLYSTARSTASTTHSNLKNLTTFLVNFISLEKIDASELQVRTHFDDEEIKGLAQSIKQHGVLQPILVVQDGDRYKVIAGERRLRASKLAGLDRIPARVLQTNDKDTHEVALRENLDRVDLHPIEEGEGYVSLLESKAYSSYEAISTAFGKPKSRITECIGFTRLPEATKAELMQRGIKQRTLLRQLLSTPPEQHIELISRHVKKEEEAEKLPVFSATPSAQPPAAPKAAKAIKPYEYSLDDKGVVVPGFRWKVGEGKEKLDQFYKSIKTLVTAIEKQFDPSQD